MILKNKLFKLSSLCVVGTIAIAANYVINVSTNLGVKTSKVDAEQGQVIVQEKDVPTGASPENNSGMLEGAVKGVNYNDYINYDAYKDIGIVNINKYLNLRETANPEGKIIGKMPPYAGCTVLGTEKDSTGNEWYKVTSGKLTGYVLKQYVVVGEEAQKMIPSVGRLVTKAKCDVLNVRTKATTDSEVLYQIAQGEELDILSIADEWVEVSVDVGQDNAFVAKEYVTISFELQKAIEIEEILYGLSSERSAILTYAKKFLGNRYVYGGTSLTNGTDCSGYTMRIYEHFGFKLPRTSREQAKVGTIVTESQLKPGDLVFYARSGRVYHVAMYAGNGKIIHAANSRKGIIISNMKYTTPYRYVRILND